MTKNRLEPGTPEFEACLLAKAQKWSDELFTTEIPEELADVGSGLIAGPRSWADVMPEKPSPKILPLIRRISENTLKRLNSC